MITRKSSAGRRYMTRFAPSMIAYLVIILGVALWFRHAPPTGALLYAAAAAPAVPLLGVIWAMGRYLVEETDEYLKARQVESILWSAGVTIAVITVWESLENFARVSHPPVYFAFTLFCAISGIVRCARSFTERT